ncbi:MAG: bacterioferritin [Alphaproteobacteria bacterium]|nr:MAG: bacterioferritin [Alphaproteobacteria bacterium]
MKGDKKVLALLNQALKSEITAIQQYLMHSHLLRNWGVAKLADFEAAEIVDERGHVDKLMARILFLEGTPNVGEFDKLLIGKNVKEILENDLKLELQAVHMYRKSAQYCEDIGDYVSSELFEELLHEEEGHVDHIETMLMQIKLIGLENFTRMHMKTADQK